VESILEIADNLLDRRLPVKSLANEFARSVERTLGEGLP
jgi:hypothetical protein